MAVLTESEGYFRNEAYDRLLAAQQAFVAVPMVEPVDSAEAIRAARAELNLTQAALAEKLGISGPAISAIENGEPIRPQTDFAIRYLLMEHRQ